MPGPVLVSQLISVFVFKEIKDCSFTISQKYQGTQQHVQHLWKLCSSVTRLDIWSLRLLPGNRESQGFIWDFRVLIGFH